MRRLLPVFLLSLRLGSAAHLPAGEPASFQQDKAQAAAIFSGTVTIFSPDSVTVVRRIFGYSTVTRTFQMTEDTRVEGQLRTNVRVTVRYRTLENGTLAALHIIVR